MDSKLLGKRQNPHPTTTSTQNQNLLRDPKLEEFIIYHNPQILKSLNTSSKNLQFLSNLKFNPTSSSTSMPIPRKLVLDSALHSIERIHSELRKASSEYLEMYLKHYPEEYKFIEGKYHTDLRVYPYCKIHKKIDSLLKM